MKFVVMPPVPPPHVRLPPAVYVFVRNPCLIGRTKMRTAGYASRVLPV